MKGDLERPSLDISSEEYDHLSESIDLVFHLGAAVQFTRDIISSFRCNVNGAKNILEFGTSCRKLIRIVHVSTAFIDPLKTSLTECVPLKKNSGRIIDSLFGIIDVVSSHTFYNILIDIFVSMHLTYGNCSNLFIDYVRIFRGTTATSTL